MHNINKVRMLDFAEHGDERGKLVVAEGEQDIPFAINRVFYIYGSQSDIVRGCHANKKTEFVLINVAGTSKVKVMDGEGNEAIYCLNRPRTGIYLPTMIWKEMYDFSEDSVLLVLCSEHYDGTEYIRNYDEFVNLIKELDCLPGSVVGWKLRSLESDDADRMFEWMHDETVLKGLKADKFRKMTREDCLSFIEASKTNKNNLHKAIINSNGTYMGTVSLKNIGARGGKSAEFAIALHPDAQGKGVGRFAMSEIMKIAFDELRLDEVYWNVLQDNMGAIHLYDSFGYERVGLTPKTDANEEQQFYYHCTRDDYYQKNRFCVNGIK